MTATTQGALPRIGLVLGDMTGIGPEIAARVLAHPRVTSDALLILADAVREYAAWPGLVPSVRDDTRLLADYLAAAAPARADVPLFPTGDAP